MTCRAFFQSYYPQGCEGTGDACEVCVPIFSQYSILIVLGVVIILIILIFVYVYLARMSKNPNLIPNQQQSQIGELK